MIPPFMISGDNSRNIGAIAGGAGGVVGGLIAVAVSIVIVVTLLFVILKNRKGESHGQFGRNVISACLMRKY